MYCSWEKTAQLFTMIKIKYTHEIKVEVLPITLSLKTANEHLLTLQGTARKENAFYIIPININLFDKPTPVVYYYNEINKHDSGRLRELFFNRITNGHYPNLMFILSALDPQKIIRGIPESWEVAPPANVMYDLRIQDQLSAETQIPKYLKINGNKAITLYSQSCEISLLPWLQTGKIDWVRQRAASFERLDINWARKIKLECEANGIPYEFDLFDERWTIPGDLSVRQHPDGIFNSAYALCNAPVKPKAEIMGFSFEIFFGAA